MKICHVITRMILGGAQENTLLTLQGLKRDTSWKLHLAFGPESGKEGSLVEEARRLGIILHPLRFLRRNLHPWQDLRAYSELFELFEEHRFDLVHTHSSKAGVLGRIAARRAGIRRIVHTIHGLAFDEFQTPWKNWIYRSAERFAAGRCDALIAVCQTMADRARAAGIQHPSEIQTVYSGFPLESFLKVQPRTPDGRFVVGMIARMFRLKGHEDLMELAPILLHEWNDLDFLIVGEGPARHHWQTWLKSHSQWRNRFRFVGRVPVSEISSYLAQMDMLVHLSWREGLARTIPQALAAQKPVCVYDVGGAREIVRNDETGWIAPAGDLNQVAAAIRTIRSQPALAMDRARRGQELVRQRFGVEIMQHDLLKIYRGLVDGIGGNP